MNKIPLPFKNLVQENMSVVAQFASSQTPLETLANKYFEGEWDALRKAVFDISEKRALRALIELAVHLRALDDQENLSEILTDLIDMSYGRLIKKANQLHPLRLREISNKVVHGTAFRWDFSEPNRPVFVCEPRDDTRDWIRAEIDIVDMFKEPTLPNRPGPGAVPRSHFPRSTRPRDASRGPAAIIRAESAFRVVLGLYARDATRLPTGGADG